MQPGRSFLKLISGLTALTVSLGLPQLALAFTLTVNDAGDAVDATPGDGICATATATCTLRAAIQEANAYPGEDEIILPDPTSVANNTAATYLLTLSGNDANAAAGDLDITDNLVLAGAGAPVVTIDANAVDRVFEILGDKTAVSIDAVTITGGIAAAGGGIANAGALSITNSTIDNNTAFSSTGGGGGIYSSGNLALNNVTVSNNTAETVSTSDGTSGGGLFISNNPGKTVSINQSVIIGNTTDQNGGGLYISNGNGTVNIAETTIDSNTAPKQFGGGIDNAGALTISRSTISNNQAANAAGIRTLGADTLAISNSTISGNETPEYYDGGSAQATSGDGGGLHLNADTVLTNVTITNNRANLDGGGIYQSSSPGKTLSLSNTLIADNTTGYPTIAPPDVLANCSINGTVDSTENYNLANDSSCALTGTNDVISGSAPLTGLSALADNGGMTLTHAIDNSSPAYSAGSTATGTDQRGVDRASQSNHDIGAYLRTGSEGTWTDLGLQVVASSSPVQTGDAIDYQVTVTNYGPTSATSFDINITMPAGMTGIEPGCSGSGSPALTCNVSSLAVGASTNFTISSTAPAALTLPYSPLTFTAAINTTQTDLNSANDTVTVDTDLSSTSDVSVAITASTTNITLGQPFSYQYQVSNAGTGAAVHGVKLKTELPSTVTLSGTLPGSCSISGTSVSCDIGDLDIGETSPVSITVVPTTADNLTNTAYVNFSGTDTDTGNNTDTHNSTVNLKSVDLKLTGTASATAVEEGNDISYTYTVENKLGSDTATGVTLTVTLPGDATLSTIISEKYSTGLAIASRYDCTSTPTGTDTDITCVLVNPLNAGDSAFVTLIATANMGSAGINYVVEANTYSSLAVDGDNSDNTSNISTDITSQTVPTNITDLDVKLSSNPATAGTGENIAYTASVLNRGPDYADGITLTVHLPAGMSIVNVPLGCTPSGRTVTCSTWTLTPDQQVSAKVVVKADNKGDYVVSAEAVNNNGQDNDPTNNSASILTTVTGAATTSTGGYKPKAGSGSLDILLLSVALCLLGYRLNRRHIH